MSQFALADNVKETTTTTGLGTVSLLGAFNTSSKTFVNGVGSGKLTAYRVDDGAGNYANRFGVVASGTPDTITNAGFISSSTGSDVSFAAGTKTVTIVPLAELFLTAAISPVLTETSIASAATTDIGSIQTLGALITGTTGITSFGASPTSFRIIRFAGALTLTHNATSLILPGGANITTAAGDVAIATSDVSGNWRVVSYMRASGSPIGGSFVPTSGAVPTDGIYLPGSHQVGCASNSTEVWQTEYLGSGAAYLWVTFPNIAGAGIYIGQPGGSYSSVGYNAKPTTSSNAWKYGGADVASFIQYGVTIQTYTAASGSAGASISPTAGPYVAALGTSWTNSSDARLKDDFTPLSEVLSILDRLTPGTYVWSGEGQTPGGVKAIGLRAQEVFETFPHIVDKPEGDDGTGSWVEGESKRWGVSEEKYGVIALQAAKEIVAELRQLRADFDGYKAAHP